MMELDGVAVTPDDLSALALVNYGHFTSMRIDGTRVRGLELHLERLVRDCRTVFAVDLDPERVRAFARRAAEAAQAPAINSRPVTIGSPRAYSSEVQQPTAPASRTTGIGTRNPPPA